MRRLASESVRRGHPDKLADQIADALLDAHIAEDPKSHTAFEVLLKDNQVTVGGERRSGAQVEIEPIVRSVIRDVGYREASWGIDPDKCEVKLFVSEQSSELQELTTNDQAIVYGYATDETVEYLPLSYVLATHLVQDLALPFLRPDGKVLCVTCDDHVESVVVSMQHDTSLGTDEVVSILTEQVQELLAEHVDEETIYHINRSGSFHVGGPAADAGLSGRKLMVDTYGTVALHGGGSFPGKDPTKVDRSGAYAARYIAKNIVGSGMSKTALVRLAYAIGVPDPIAIDVTADVPIDPDMIRERFPLKIEEIIHHFDLRRPIYRELSFGGHFGRNMPWEKIDVLEK